MDKKILLIFIIGLSLVIITSFGLPYLTGNVVKEIKGKGLCSNDTIFVDLYYDGSFAVLNKSLGKGCSPNYLHNFGERYSYDLQANGKSLYKAEFNPELIYSDADTEGGVENAKKSIVLASPSLEGAEKVNIYDNNTKILEINIYDVGATSCRID